MEVTAVPTVQYRECADPLKLKFLVVATPKTGNTWIKWLLAAAYNLPMYEAPAWFDESGFQAFGDLWATHQHLQPSPALLEWAARVEVCFVTTVRHPGDVLVSYKNYVKNIVSKFPRIQTDDPLGYSMILDGDKMGIHTLEFVRRRFFSMLTLSLLWQRLGSYVVRYEDLTTDPIKTLTALTNFICPLCPDRIRAAVALCEINRLRSFDPNSAFHFRRGTSGEWREAIPSEIVDVFRRQEPYPSLFAALGYTLDKDHDREKQTQFSYAAIDPFQGASKFENGVSLAPILCQLYLSVVPGSQSRWPNPTATRGNHSFFHWLNSSCEEDENSQRQEILITNLAHQIYKVRPDLVATYPDPLGRNRLEFCQWFINSGMVEHQLAPEFAAPLIISIARLPSMVAPKHNGQGDPGCVPLAGIIEEISAMNERGESQRFFVPGDVLKAQFRVRAGHSIEAPIYELTLRDPIGQIILGTGSLSQEGPTKNLLPGDTADITFTLKLNVPPGVYYVCFGWTRQDKEGNFIVIHRRFNELKIEVLRQDRSFSAANCPGEIQIVHAIGK